MTFLFNDDTESLDIPSAKSIYGSSKGKIAVFSIEAEREVDGDWVTMPDYKRLTKMVESFDDIRFYFSFDGKNYDVESVDFAQSPHLKEGHEIITVHLK